MSELITKNFGTNSVPLSGDSTGEKKDEIVTLLDTELNPIYPYTLFGAIGELDSTGIKYTKGVLKSAAKRNSSEFLLSLTYNKDKDNNKTEFANDVDPANTTLSNRDNIKFITSITAADVDKDDIDKKGAKKGDKKLKYSYITYASIYRDLEDHLKPDLVTNNITYSGGADSALSNEKKADGSDSNVGTNLTDILNYLYTEVKSKAAKGDKGDTPTFSWSESNKYLDKVNSILNITIGGETTSQDLRGPQGEPGIKGEDGKGVTIKGSVNPDNVNQLTDSTVDGSKIKDAQPGDAYLCGGHLWVYVQESNEFKDVGTIQGPRGEDGKSPVVEVKDDKYIYVDGVKQQYLKGDKGEDGKDGTSVNIIGPVESETILNNDTDGKKLTANAGDGYILEEDLWVFSPEQKKFIKAGKIRGPKGDDGNDGADGHSPVVEVKDDKYIYVDGVQQQYLKGDPGDPATATLLCMNGEIDVYPDSGHKIDINAGDYIDLTRKSTNDITINVSLPEVQVQIDKDTQGPLSLKPSLPIIIKSNDGSISLEPDGANNNEIDVRNTQGVLSLELDESDKSNKKLQLKGTSTAPGENTKSTVVSTINVNSIDTTYTAGDGISISSSNVISVDTSTRSKWILGSGSSIFASLIDDSPYVVIKTAGQFQSAKGFFETSDARLKDITSDLSLEKSTEFIKSSHTVNYILKSDSTKTPNIGFIAQEVEEYFPEVVESHSDGYKSINYAKLGVVLFPVVKDLLARVEALEVQLSKK